MFLRFIFQNLACITAMAAVRVAHAHSLQGCLCTRFLKLACELFQQQSFGVEVTQLRKCQGAWLCQR